METFTMKRNTRGFTLIELLVVIAIIALLMGLLLPALAKALGNARVRKDQGQLKGISATYSIYGESDKRKQYPIPGRIDRQAVNINTGYNNVYHGVTDGQVQGLGDPDDNVNTSAWLHSFMIGANYYGPEILISSNEQNPTVATKGDQAANPEEEAYDFGEVDVASDQYWDPMFSADITGAGESANSFGGQEDVCHTSYANNALCGKRLDNWKDGSSNTVVLSSRGPEILTSSDMTDDAFTKSPTLLLYGPAKLWEGIFVGGDGSAHYANDMWHNNKEYTSKADWTNYKDNTFMSEFHDYDTSDGHSSGDNFSVLNVGSTESTVTTVYDELLP